MKFNNKSIDVLIVGGAGHIGLPLGLLFAAKKKKVVLLDKNIKNIKKINNLEMPFMENGGVQLLKKNKKNIFATNNTSLIKFAKIVIICIGTPIKNSKPDLINFFKMFRDIKSELNPKNLLVIRSSIYPGTVKKISNILGKDFKNISYCPERVVQGKSISELPKLPQIISGVSEKSINDSKKLFELICKKIIITSILEAELIKLFSNAWRYINFSISNQFFMICDKFEIDFKILRKNMIDGYDRNKGIPYAGFTAGPCLYKDTAQLNSFLNNSFSLGKAATKVNQGLTNFIYKKIKNTFKEKLKEKKIGILGVAFKPDIDDIRDSLSIDLYKFLKRKNLKIKISDDFVKMDEIIDKERLIKESDIIILGVPHSSYKKLKIPKNKYLIDTWGFFEK
jgi:UDP-N-acetyl-D-mannosaminuronic acid dehydrogenase